MLTGFVLPSVPLLGDPPDLRGYQSQPTESHLGEVDQRLRERLLGLSISGTSLDGDATPSLYVRMYQDSLSRYSCICCESEDGSA